MPVISNLVRIVISVLIVILTVVLPETGWIQAGTAQFVVFAAVALIALLLGPPLVSAIRPRIHVTRPSIRVEAGPFVKEIRQRRLGTKSPPEGRGTRKTLHEIGAARQEPKAVADQAVEAPADISPDDVPPDWMARFWKGKQVFKCAWDDFRTIVDARYCAHLDTHTDPPEPADAKHVGKVPLQWAYTPLHFRGDGGHFIPGVPADPDHTLYATQPRALELVNSGLYGIGPHPTERHVLAETGPPLRCRCGRTEPTMSHFQSHLSYNESADTSRRPPKAKDLIYEDWIAQRNAWCEARAAVLGRGEALIADLQKVPVQPPPGEEDRWYEPLRAWLHDDFAAKIVEPYWGTEQQAKVTSDAMSDGATHENKALPPDWRRKAVANISARMAWLQAQPHDCG